MITRQVIGELQEWSDKTNRKPLILRGARQVGKTTVVEIFAKNFKQYIYLNLELSVDREPFQKFTDMETLVQTLFFLKNMRYDRKTETLIFIDEIQEVPEAMNILRYFYEQMPEIRIIAAGSLLETIFNQQLTFPVGRVEFLVIRPVSFPEFLDALGEHSALEQLKNIPLNEFAHDKIMRLFHTYALVGGMPEIVSHYAEKRDLTSLATLYDGLLATYMDDIEKYAKGNEVHVLRHAIRTGFFEAGKRIKFQGFGNSNYGSKEMGEALRTLEKTMLFSLLYPLISAQLPALPDFKKSPRLQALDTGLMNYILQIQKEIIGTEDLQKVYQGTMIEHLVGQELLAHQYKALSSLYFWVREKNTSQAEVDYVVPFDGKLIPIEVKSGKEGKLRSLHQFMNLAPHNKAVRLYAGKLEVTTVTTIEGKTYQLLNLPYFLVSQLEKYLAWFV
ncbi:AAA family ATPase [Pedobacter sp. UBA4863]|uniref:ATP-binding protein n=1 Tax=Pedobacter sp. UBA4863 TaxID=1947060 RepID=UPI0025F67138|nr:AAA family ATPase [Pedobacter sp. UBA4863]